ncbi:Lysyl-tRNA synthetase (class I) [Richelia intracellularis HM01]|nr:Lysyl-tRNA synthetase (class I) [Richelia intracellularis HM01]
MLFFSISKELEINPANAFQSIYLSFLGKVRGPKAGTLLSYLDKSFVISRIHDVIALNKSNSDLAEQTTEP